MKKTLGWFMAVTLAAALVYMGIGIRQILDAGGSTSFPWYTACYFTAWFFGPPLLLELFMYAAVCLYFRKKGERQSRGEKT